ncbi:RNA binding Pelota-like protein [Jatrophihabitans sp. GAS493]|uniref:phosphoribosyltransferase domain-containing protein n=1 Tax=Jatrophihabitans sp. GAS493 TaxID=1907575 RepID=UPI000BBF8FC8|nr:phosphoribosyltransferase domain-containing protein [Jatrophihabitans sp. GAS493]SOD71742.1 RNA binding Pelota-like protein [Jatrophihabitans sp. GAS493]
MTDNLSAIVADPWPGQWVSDRLDLRLRTQSSPVGLELTDLLGLALRRNPRRVQLLVSTVLGKHVPTDPRVVYGAGRLLGLLVSQRLVGGHSDGSAQRRGGELLRAALDGIPGAGPALLELCDDEQRVGVDQPLRPIVLGYAETATALGHAVADSLAADYLHSTRRRVLTGVPVGGFEEEHSHASSHLLLPEDPAFFTGHSPLVLVDDEFSTGTTLLNTIAALQAQSPRGHYVVAALVDLRGPADRARLDDLAAALGVRIDVVSLVAGTLPVTPATIEQGQRLVQGRLAANATAEPMSVEQPEQEPAGALRRVEVGWPVSVPDGARHGVSPVGSLAIRQAATAAAAAIAEQLSGDSVLVLGFEELMYAPLQIALALAVALAEAPDHPDQPGPPRQPGQPDHPNGVRFSSTTRSPVLAVDEPGYAIRTGLRFDSIDEVPATADAARYAYNVAGHAFTDVVLVVDAVADTPALRHADGLLEKLREIVPNVLLVVLPSKVPSLPSPLHAPEFGSYAAEEVSWLLTDLSGVDLEAPIEEREEAIQAGGAHYAESLPIEYQPSVEYQQLFVDALAESADRIARAVGVVTELVLDARGGDTVLVSLARAGTPVGVLMRRWAAATHDLQLPHFAVSIVRGRGIDSVALRYLVAQFGASRLMFVDGWTGKGAITRELSDAVAQANREFGLAGADRLSPELAVLADTGGCTEFFGTRDDFLIPSACLNSTVSGLVSRTVLNDRIGPRQFHGAKFYRELAGVDVSATFLDAVSRRFPAVADRVATEWRQLRDSDRHPTWAGWTAVEKISAEYGIGNLNLVKPGVGETTRVLLRRVPWRVLMRPDAAASLGHIKHLADSRGVGIDYVEDLAFSCVGLIHPQFTRGAVGADGTAVRR